MHARLSEFVEAPEWVDLLAEGAADDALGMARPKLGDTEADMAAIRNRRERGR